MIKTRVQNYVLKSLLGAGGMGVVYLAEHLMMKNRKAAVKMLRCELPADPGLIERFFNEAHAINALSHRNIVQLLDVGILPDDAPYMIFEFLEGEPLSRVIARRGRLPVDEALEVARQAASALAAAHARGIIHRDLKPDNLFIVHDPEHSERGLLKVLDFGIAKLHREVSGVSLQTRNGTVMGTLKYMSPEQCRGVAAEIDSRTDVYALGVVLYEMLTGQAPFAAEGLGQMLMMHMVEQPPPPSSLNPEIPANIEGIILKALAKAREDRFATMDELLAALGPSRAALELPADAPAAGATAGRTLVLPSSSWTLVLEQAEPQGLPGPQETTLGASAGAITTTAEARPRSRRAAVVRRTLAGLVVAGMVAVILFRTGARGPARVSPVVSSMSADAGPASPAPWVPSAVAESPAPPAAPATPLVSEEPAAPPVPHPVDANQNVVRKHRTTGAPPSKPLPPPAGHGAPASPPPASPPPSPEKRIRRALVF